MEKYNIIRTDFVTFKGIATGDQIYGDVVKVFTKNNIQYAVVEMLPNNERILVKCSKLTVL